MLSSAGFDPKRERFRRKIAKPAPMQGFSLALFGGTRRKRAPQATPRVILLIPICRPPQAVRPRFCDTKAQLHTLMYRHAASGFSDPAVQFRIFFVILEDFS